MTRTELPERIETERLVLRVRTVADAEAVSYTHLDVYKRQVYPLYCNIFFQIFSYFSI